MPTLGIVILAVLVNDFEPMAPESTVRVKLLLALNAPSLTVKVMAVVPLCPATGVTVTVRLLALPPKTIFPLGTKVVFDELPLNPRLPAAVSGSPTVKLSGPTDVPTEVL